MSCASQIPVLCLTSQTACFASNSQSPANAQNLTGLASLSDLNELRRGNPLRFATELKSSASSAANSNS